MAVRIVAELSANHQNDFSIAAKTIRAMAHAGADAIKVQTYRPESLTLNSQDGYFAPRKEGLWKGYTPWELYSIAAMPYEWQPKLQALTEELGMTFFSSPFDRHGVDFLESLDCPMYKIASLEINHLPLIEYVASMGKPVLISTGAADEHDIEAALAACRRQGNEDVTLLQCTSHYPATRGEANLRTIPDMKQRFGVSVGVSDHTLGACVPAAAVALGAEVVEKHCTLNRSHGGPDAPFSLEPNEFAEMVRVVRNTEEALGTVSYAVDEKDRVRRRSLFATQDIARGERFREDNIAVLRPGHGIPPRFYHGILGTQAQEEIKRGTPLRMEHITL
ncbi:pseudaminic acid synthase [Chitinivibrio alkaliphilus]|uniref:N-acetylneuraminic acid (Neu5Ac) synthase n=1 Tax=Chitinivibrio alkaliphilus ACht1 TaxID=1313304 RepID=U7D8N5_9BACT|nr:pseudaminic acid synthase [Chitinivibrio alkaliphilus]ERP39285.1 N-acetylneuraminic acid (Neu5Ac) synthase [Chitinivibrio alkaliphilus ACht1]